MVEWEWSGEAPSADRGWVIRGWALKERLDKEKEADRKKEPMEKIEEVWRRML